MLSIEALLLKIDWVSDEGSVNVTTYLPLINFFVYSRIWKTRGRDSNKLRIREALIRIISYHLIAPF